MTQNTETLPTTQSERSFMYGKTDAAMRRYQSMFLAFVGGMTVVDIAREFACSPSTVYQALKVVEQKQLEAPDSVKLAYMVHRRRKASLKLQEMFDAIETRREELTRLAEKRLLEGELNDFIDLQKVISRTYSEQRRIIDQIRKEDDALAVFWGVIRSAGIEINISTKPEGGRWTGAMQTKMAEMARKYREELHASYQ